jgi:tetratricopeptide (TPR) repeat protein
VRRLRVLLVALLVAFGTVAPAHAEDVSDLITAATGAFREAKDASGTQARTEAFRRAAGLYDRALAAGHRNGALEYNAGNAWFLAGDVGRAVLHYRRAQLLRPGDPQVEANLQTARARRVDQIEETAGRAVAETVFFWHRGLSYEAKFNAALAAWALGVVLLAFAMAGWGRRLRVRWLWRAGAVCLAVALALGVSFLVERHRRGRHDAAVVLADETELRKGDGLSYPVRYEHPIHSGAEVRVLQRRPGWVEVELRDGKTGWLPAAHVERV